VIPKISASNRLAPLKYREYLTNFRFLALQELVEKTIQENLELKVQVRNQEE